MEDQIILFPTALIWAAAVGLIVITALFAYFLSISFRLQHRLGGEGTEATKMDINSGLDEKSQSGSYIDTLEKALERRARELETRYLEKTVQLNALLVKLKDLASTLDKDTIFEITLDLLEKGIGARQCLVLLIDRKTGELYPVKLLHPYGEDRDETVVVGGEKVSQFIPGLTIPIKVGDENVIGFVAANGGILTKANALRNPVTAGLIGKSPFPSLACASLNSKDEIMGVIVVMEIEGEEFTKDNQLLFTTVANFSSIVMSNAQLFELTRKDLMSTRRLTQKEVQDKQRLKNMFSRFTSSLLVEQIMENPDRVTLGGEKRNLTVLFTDIRNFTQFAESNPPELVVEVLNNYLSVMTEVILKFHGTLDKFIGDAIMAIWGAPVFMENHARLAVMAGLKILKAVNNLSKEYAKRGFRPLDVGIGINTGEMIVGTIGSLKRLDYTVIGDSVNVAARMQELTRKYENHMIISETTYTAVQDIIEVKSLGTVNVKGRKGKVPIYEVLRIKPDVDRKALSKEVLDLGDYEVGGEFKKQDITEPEPELVPVAGEESVICQRCQTPNTGRNLVYCISCGGPLG